MSLRVLDAELRVGHEVVDGAASLGCLQTLIGRHAVSEGVHNTNLKDEGERSSQGLMEEPSGKVQCSTLVLSTTLSILALNQYEELAPSSNNPQFYS